ncbi:MAG: glycosyltransferase family 39 protein [Bacteroidetes bacterium]|nr:glycosyltransferase family 39 protein [Bacteroidota bacterium]
MSDRLAFGLLVLICVLYVVMCFSGLHELNIYVPDSGRYMLWANALARGEGYVDSSSPTPTRYVIHSPLYAVLLVPSQWLFPNSIEAAKATTVLFAAGSIIALFFLFRQWVGNTFSIIASLLFSVHPETVNYSTQVLTESPFIFVSIVLFVVLYKYSTSDSKTIFLKVQLYVLTGIAVLLREVGVVLALSVVIFFFAMKQKKEALNVLLTLILVYGAWFVRNEIIVAGEENPSTRNSKIFTTHMYTEPSTPMIREYYERVTVNSKIYGKYILHTMFTLGYRYPLLNELYYREVPVSWILQARSVLDSITTSVTILVLGIGIFSAFRRRHPLNFLFVTYAILTGTVILIYPVTDVRFLYPLLPLYFFYVFYGISSCIQQLQQLWRFSKYGIGLLVVVLSIPNVVWSSTYHWQNYRYAHSPEECYTLLAQGHEYFSSALKPATQWLAERIGSNEVLLSKWNEVALFSGGRKVALTNPQAYWGEFEELIRDYSIRFIICGLRPDSSNEYQMLFAQSKRYVFVPVYRKGSTEIRMIVRRSNPPSWMSSIPRLSYENDFTEAYSYLETNPQSAYERFVAMGIKYRNIDCIFNIGVAFTFMDSLDRAEKYFKKFLYLQQAGAYVRLVNGHLYLLANLRELSTLTGSHELSYGFQNVGLLLWQLGYHQRSLMMMDSALSKERTFFPASISGAVLAFQLGDTLKSRWYLANARTIEPNHILTQWLSRVHLYSDSLHRMHSLDGRMKYRCSTAIALKEMGFINAAIDELSDALEDTSTHQGALELLAQYFEEKKRYYSALNVYERLLSVYPMNEQYRAKYEVLKGYLRTK